MGGQFFAIQVSPTRWKIIVYASTRPDWCSVGVCQQTLGVSENEKKWNENQTKLESDEKVVLKIVLIIIIQSTCIPEFFFHERNLSGVTDYIGVVFGRNTGVLHFVCLFGFLFILILVSALILLHDLFTRVSKRHTKTDEHA